MFPRQRPTFLLHLLLLAVVLSTGFAYAQKDTSPHSEAALVAEGRTVQPGTPFYVALRIRMEPKWHSYWINPGDSGLATKITWELPEGFQAGEIEWPHPEKIPTPPMMTYGYENDVWLLTQITPPENLTQSTVTLQAKARWLICKEACIPATENVQLTLPVKNEPAEIDPRWSAGFKRARAALPASNSDWSVHAERAAEGKGFVLRLRPPAGADTSWVADSVYFFPSESAILDHAAPQKVTRDGESFLIDLKPSDYLEQAPEQLNGILLAPENAAWNNAGSRALAVNATIEKAGAAAVAGSTEASEQSGSTTLPLALVLAFGGGLLLNLMPCVFPVLSLKILGFVKQSADDTARIKKHGFMFGFGVLLSFWVLAGVLLVLRAAGGSIAWGFQLQSPLFVAALVVLLFLIGLNLLSAFEIGLSLTRVSAPSKTTHGYSGSFWSGVLATIVATPCTAPFMGSALAFALTQPAVSALLVFTFLGAGMALPYVVLSLNPSWIKKLPRPGAWMETFKQLMAFPIFATALWLLAVFGLQTGVEGMAYLLGALLLLGIAIWISRRFEASTLRPTARVLTRAGALVALLLATIVAWNAAKFSPPEAAAAVAANGDQQKIAWQPFSSENVEAALSEGRPVFIDFTAAWCITCQVNKRVTLNQPEVTEAFAERDVVLLRADWTRRDAEITRALEKYGRSGVPTYVLHSPEGDKAEVLPEVLSPAIVQKALNQLPTRVAAQSKP